jgi:hypothetical protein
MGKFDPKIIIFLKAVYEVKRLSCTSSLQLEAHMSMGLIYFCWLPRQPGGEEGGAKLAEFNMRHVMKKNLVFSCSN